MTSSHHTTTKGETDAGNGSKAICRVSNVLRSPSPDPRSRRGLSNYTPLRTSSRRLWTAVRITALPAHGVRLRAPSQQALSDQARDREALYSPLSPQAPSPHPPSVRLSPSTITNAKTPWEVVANSVGSDILACGQFYPQHFSQLQSSPPRRPAPIANRFSPDTVKSSTVRSNDEIARKFSDGFRAMAQ